MKRSICKGLTLILILALSALWHLSVPASPAYAEGEPIPDTVEIRAPDGLSTKIYSQPTVTSEPIGMALDRDVLETVKDAGEFFEIRVPGRNRTGFVLKDDTIPWTAPEKKGVPLIALVLIALVIIAAAAGGFFFFKARTTQEAAKHAAEIPASIKRAEELFRSGDYREAITEFNTYLRLQGGEIRNPDVYRRLAICYQKCDATAEAADSWEKMRRLGGLKSMEDYTLGVELMRAQGREVEATEIYEALLDEEKDEDKQLDIRERLFEAYKRLRQPRELVRHAVAIMGLRGGDAGVLSSTVNFLMSEGETDEAIESGNQELITTICREFLEDRVTTPEASRIYLKCLEFDRTDLRLHRMLATIYAQAGDHRKAVIELTILSQLDKDKTDSYMDEAARLYVETGNVQDALAEGNPTIVKKIAQAFLSRSEVHPDAVQVYEKVLEIQPKAVGINKMLSTVYLTRGDLERYMTRLRVLHEIDGKNHDYLTDLALCVIDNDLIDQTIKEGNRELNAKILKQLIKRGASNDKAVILLERLLKHEPDNAVIRGALVKAYERRGDQAKCLGHLLHLIRINPKEKELIEKAVTLAVEHNLLDPVLKQSTAVVVLATARQLVKRKAATSDARKVLERALSVKPDDASIKEYLSRLPGEKPAKPAAPAPRVEPEREPTTGIEDAAKPARRADAQDIISKKAKKTGRITSTVPSRTQPVPTMETPEPIDLGGPQDYEKREPRPVPSAQTPPEPPIFSEDEAEEEDRQPPGIETQQLVSLIDHDAQPPAAAPATTFVSGFEKGQGIRDYSPEQLFLPATGGLAYKDTEVLVEDGWGNLYFGIEVNTGRKVLIREFRKDVLDSSSMKDFVSQVSDIAYNLVHDNILGLEEMVTRAGIGLGFVHPYMFRTLEQLVKSARQPSFNDVLSLVKQIMDGVAHAHYYRGLDGKFRRTYHFHLQPSHILVSENLKECKITGMGYSQVYRTFIRASKPRWQEPGMNPATMPPEFFRTRVGTIVEKAADIYSLGVVLYFLVTGDYPFEGPAFEDYKFGHTKMNAAPAMLTNPSVPEWLDRIILKCLEKDPEKRWESITEMQEAYEEGMKR